VAIGRFKPNNRASTMVAPEREVPGKYGGKELTETDGDDHRPGDFIAQFFSAQPKLHEQEGNAANENGSCDVEQIVP